MKSDLSRGTIGRALSFAVERNRYEARQKSDLLELIAAHQVIANAQADLNQLLSSICERTLKIVEADASVVELREGEDMVYRGVAGMARDLLGLRLKINGSLSGIAYATNTISLCDDCETDARVDRDACHRTGARSMAIVPLSSHGEVIGILKAISTRPFAFSPLDIERLRALSQVTGSILAQATLLSEKQAALTSLEKALQEVKTLSGLLPICSACKKIRDDSGYWNQLEDYICQHSDAHFTHGICPVCAQKFLAELDASI